MFLIGLIGFACASALGGAATGFATLVIARAIQGGFGAMLAPSALSILTTTFVDPSDRGKAFGVYGAIAGSGGAVGLLLGGVLTEYLNWRWCLYVNVALAGVALVGALRLLVNQPRNPDVRLDTSGFGPGRDRPGGVCLRDGGGRHRRLGIAIDYRLDRGWRRLAGGLRPGRETSSAPVTTPAGGFEPVPRRLLPGHRAHRHWLVRHFLVPYLLPSVDPPLLAGQVRLGVPPGYRYGHGRIYGVHGGLAAAGRPRPLVPLGMLVAAAGVALLRQLALHTSYVSTILPGLILVGLGLGLVFGCAINTATFGARPEDAGVASAMVNTSQQVGGSIGTALLNSIAASAATAYVVAHGPAAGVVAEAAVHSYVVSFTVVLGIFVVAAIVSAAVLPSGAPKPATGEVAREVAAVPA